MSAADINYKLIHGDCLEALLTLEDNSVDSIVTDPPGGIAFMGKNWDNDKGGRDAWIAWMEERAAECLRVLKPGGHALVWAIPRTSHWTATAWENAGFEVRDRVSHIFGSGFPKSHNIGKSIGLDKWGGWGTALKPAMEDWWLLRKPLSEPTIAANVLRWGTGGINVDGCRVATDGEAVLCHSRTNNFNVDRGDYNYNGRQYRTNNGRFPAHLTHDGSDEVMAGFPNRKVSPRGKPSNGKNANCFAGYHSGVDYDDSGSAARFFYCSKASKADRTENGQIDNPHPTVKANKLMRWLCRLVTPPGGIILDPFTGSGSTGKAAIDEGFGFIGIEQEAESVEVTEARLQIAQERRQELESMPEQLSI